MVSASCACGAAPVLPKRLKREALDQLREQTKLTHAEVKALYARFRRLAPAGYLNKDQFKETMGVLGLTDDPFLPDRMFQVFDADQDNKLTFHEFATSLAIMIRGTEDEKLKMSFEMTAGRREANGIFLEDFQRLICACNAMMSSLVAPNQSSTTTEEVEQLFNDLSSDEGGPAEDKVITLEAYKNAARYDDMFLHFLGLEPSKLQALAAHKGHKHHQSTTPKGGVQPGPSTSTVSRLAAPALAAKEGHVTISAAQLDDLQDRVQKINMLLHRDPWATNGFRTEPQPSLEAAADDPDEHWWTPLPRRPEICRPQKPAAAVDEVCAEIDKVLGWCSDIEAAAEGGGAGRQRTQTPAHPRTQCSVAIPSGDDGAAAPAAADDGAVGGPPGSPRRPPEEARAGGIPCARDVSREPSTPTGLGSTQKKPMLAGGSVLSHMPKSNIHKASVKQYSTADLVTDLASANEQANRADSVDRRRARKHGHRLLGPKKGLAVHFGHENWNMVLSMMIGIRMAIGRSKHEIAREVEAVDFIMKEKFSIIPRIANIFDATVSKRVTMTRFIDYAPLVFQGIRQRFGIQQDEFLRSVGPEQLLGNIVLGNFASLSELSSEGKSGAFFYYTADGKYMLKTVTRKESSLFRAMLKAYYEHIVSNPGTLLIRFLGLHCLSVRKHRKGILAPCAKSLPYKVKKVYFVVMANMFNTSHEIHRRYDIKGSWVGRQTPPEKYDQTVALKDVDFQTRSERIHVGEERKSQLVAQIEQDSNFLCSNNIIDYSLLLGIHELGSQDEGDDSASELAAQGQQGVAAAAGAAAAAGRFGQAQLPTSPTLGSMPGMHTEPPLHVRDGGGMLSPDKRFLYFIGVIDILTLYDTFKAMEARCKALRYNPRGVSCCPPAMYAERFTSFMQQAFV